MSDNLTRKERANQLLNVIEELSGMLSARIWQDETIKGQFELAALADGISSAASELNDLTESHLTDITE